MYKPFATLPEIIFTKTLWIMDMTESVDFPYQKEFLGSLALVHKCGNIIKEAFFKPKVISVKTEATDLVTQTDKEVEEVLRKGLSLLLPSAPFVGEESSGRGEQWKRGAVEEESSGRGEQWKRTCPVRGKSSSSISS